MITGYDPSAVDVAVENGADLFLTKPFRETSCKQPYILFLKEA
jgi:hypothetical protein